MSLSFTIYIHIYIYDNNVSDIKALTPPPLELNGSRNFAVSGKNNSKLINNIWNDFKYFNIDSLLYFSIWIRKVCSSWILGHYEIRIHPDFHVHDIDNCFLRYSSAALEASLGGRVLGGQQRQQQQQQPALHLQPRDHRKSRIDKSTGEEPQLCKNTCNGTIHEKKNPQTQQNLLWNFIVNSSFK